MFESITTSQSDTLLALMGAYRADARAQKMDVGVGVYRDKDGATPVMSAVKTAEARVLASQDSKAYLGLVGNAEFNAAMVKLVLGDDGGAARNDVRAVQTPGGCGALRSLLDLVALARPKARVWLSDPTWMNHPVLVAASHLTARTYPYFDLATQKIRFDDMMASLATAGPDDVVLLHGCCHNPSGADLSDAQWTALSNLAAERGFLPMIDLAYQGLGRGLDTDAFGVRCMAAQLPELLVAVSCSKNFGLYRDRVGCAMVLSKDAANLATAFDRLLGAIRGNYSMPPDHGAAVVACILADPALRQAWEDELQTMRERLQGLRQALVKRLRVRTGGDGYDFIAEQHGMFSLLNLTPDQVKRLRDTYAVYMPNDSRTNIAGLRTDQVDAFVEAFLAVRANMH
jgi:aspartate/tyrosine/aromatic aminotransferase